MTPPWLSVRRADTPLILAMPHGGTVLPDGLADRFRSPWLARRDADWHIAALYAGLADATIVATDISRSIIDVNRDPSGASLYPGQATTELCPTTTFDGEPLYADGEAPDDREIATRRDIWFDPYHAAIAGEVARLRARHRHVVVYDCHSIRSHVPRLFDGELPVFNLGTNDGVTCDRRLRDAVAAVCAASGRGHVVDGRFRGGWTTRHYGRPGEGVHAIQMELAIRSYLTEPDAVSPGNWPPPYDPAVAAPLRADLADILSACLEFAR
ncbi:MULTISPECIES: N-formylglutamate deformylase [unclassified Sphingomonas]|uniref:N-formylglutamate deformylase n=1 Tax=unclassified Sphingomonas TaxID=196159 RepID=UPI0006F5D280|nr:MULTISPECIES: N-formylglutamate deformylase [unclassified Sphingomonas]KQM63119.1 N-formylglutamate deformylase [Sphingomonas sp. Leaf16]KQN14978.1 N-formylglutamate deformylase [Sphingomonas sp. Leaf29]KQN20492.1 N-formylglutamate deformylase [Sphingomonas sp. Leaf32]